jgi:hypothetical protein
MESSPQNLEELAEQLKRISDMMAGQEASDLPASKARQVRKTVTEAYENIRKVIEDLDPLKHPGFVFDPSNPNIVGRLVGITMVAQKRKPLVSPERFYGSGVYAIYYTGKFKAYAGISGKEHPIYVGKADPADAGAKTAVEQGDKLSGRLAEHRKNICRAETTLSIEDFEYRALVVQTGWQTSAEGYLIDLFKPIWNSEVNICYGFGKHGDDPTTRANLRSPWDTLHPGRDWAHRDPKMKDARALERIKKHITKHREPSPPYKSIDQIFRTFLDEIREVP